MNEEKNRCWFCNQAAPPGEMICTRKRCQDFDKEMIQALDERDRMETREALLAAFNHRARCDENWNLNRVQRWFYTVKFFLCVLFRLRYHGKETFPDSVEVGWGKGVWTCSGACLIVEVGHGVFSGWWWDCFNE